MMTPIEKIKQSVDICKIVAQYCGGLRPSGYSKRYLMGYCPFCQADGEGRKKRPKLWVDPEKQLCNCFKCGDRLPMDVVTFVARVEGLTIRDTISRLGEGLT